MKDGCPACGEPIDYCQGHGPIGDPFGYSVLQAHDNGRHTLCVTLCDQPNRCPWCQDTHLNPEDCVVTPTCPLCGGDCEPVAVDCCDATPWECETINDNEIRVCATLATGTHNGGN